MIKPPLLHVVPVETDNPTEVVKLFVETVESATDKSLSASVGEFVEFESPEHCL